MRAEYIHESHPPQLRKEIYYMENQSRLPRLDNMKRGLTSTYIEDYIYLDPEDRSIEPVSSNMPLARSDSSSKLI